MASEMEKSLYSKNHKVFLALLKQVRLDAGMRQEDVAKRLKKPQSFVSKYESGERRLDILELGEISEAMGLSLAEFVRRLERSLGRTR